MASDTEREEVPDDRGLNRRTLARAAAGGFMLAASGLYLPAEDDAEAREGALGGDLGGRRGPGLRGRDERKWRDHGDDKHKNKRDAPRGGLFRSTALPIEASGLVNYEFNLSARFYYRTKTGLNSYGPWIFARDANAASDRYAPDRYRIGVLISAEGSPGRGPDLFIDVRNLSFGYPQGAAYTRTPLDPRNGLLGFVLIKEQDFALTRFPSGVEGHEVVTSYVLKERSPFPAWTALVSLKRNLDSDDHIEFALSVNGI